MPLQLPVAGDPMCRTVRDYPGLEKQCAQLREVLEEHTNIKCTRPELLVDVIVSYLRLKRGKRGRFQFRLVRTLKCEGELGELPSDSPLLMWRYIGLKTLKSEGVPAPEEE